MSNSDSDNEMVPMIPVIGAIYRISFSFTCTRFAIVEKITKQTVLFRIIECTYKSLHGDGTYSTGQYTPLKDKKTDKTFRVYKKKFDGKARIPYFMFSGSRAGAYPCNEDSKIESTAYY